MNKPLPKDIRSRRTAGAPGTGSDGLTPLERLQRAQYMLLPPGFYPPFGAKEFSLVQNQAVGPGPTTVTFTGAGATFQLPVGSAGYVTEIQFVVNNLLLTSQITFRLLFDGAAVQGYDNMLMPQAGLAVYIWSPDKVYIPVDEGTTIAVGVTVTDAVTYNLSMLVRGWHYIAQMNDRWNGLAG